MDCLLVTHAPPCVLLSSKDFFWMNYVIAECFHFKFAVEFLFFFRFSGHRWGRYIYVNSKLSYVLCIHDNGKTVNVSLVSIMSGLWCWREERKFSLLANRTHLFIKFNWNAIAFSCGGKNIAKFNYGLSSHPPALIYDFVVSISANSRGISTTRPLNDFVLTVLWFSSWWTTYPSLTTNRYHYSLITGTICTLREPIPITMAE